MPFDPVTTRASGKENHSDVLACCAGLGGGAQCDERAVQKRCSCRQAGDSDEIAEVLSFLAPDEASYVSGVELFVDGGVAQI